MRAGLPVVASNVPGNRELVADGDTGLLFSPGDANALAQKVLMLIQDEPLAKSMGYAGQKKIKAFFSIDKMISKHTNFYISLIQDL